MTDPILAALEQSTQAAVEQTKAAQLLAQDVSGKMGQIDARVAAKAQEVDDAILNLGNSHANQIVSYYDNERHSQTSIAATIDPADETKTQWVKVPTTQVGYHMYPYEGRLTKVHTSFCYTYYAGYNEDPPYSNDTSATYVQFVLANDAATSEQINQRLEQLGKTPARCGGWWDGARVYDAVSVNIADCHPYSRLWVRWINRGVKGPAQNVMTYGGNPSFSVVKVINYPLIRS